MSESIHPDGECFDLCVIGAGVSGLYLARLVATRLNLRVLLLDRHPEAGGCLASLPVLAEGQAAGWLELGAHTCYNSYARFLDLAGDPAFLDKIVPRKSMGFRMVEGGRMRSIPSCLNWFELALSLPRLIGATKQGQSAEAYFSRILGRGNWARVLHPSLNAVASQETKGFPADALFKPRAKRRKDIAKSFALRGGLGPAVQALADHPGIRCVLNAQAQSLTKGPEGFEVVTKVGEAFRCRQVALAVPPDAAAALVASAFPALAGHLGIPSRSRASGPGPSISTAPARAHQRRCSPTPVRCWAPRPSPWPPPPAGTTPCPPSPWGMTPGSGRWTNWSWGPA